MEYPRPSLTVDAVVFAGSGEDVKVLLIERAHDPYKGQVAFPGGFVDKGELPYQACLRELLEETALKLERVLAVPLTLRAREGRDPRGWTISQPYLFHLEEPVKVKAGDDARSARWVPLAELDRLAFDHGAILCEALGKYWQDMPTAAPQLLGYQGFGAPVLPLRTTFFGGSFNPCHDGHLACVKGFPKPHELVIVPDTNPFKGGPGTRCYWAEYRELGKRFANKALAVFPGFWGMEHPNPTVSWLPYVAVEEVGLLMGDDSLVSLPKWFLSEELLACMDHLYVVPRRSRKQDVDQSLQWIRDVNPDCRVKHLSDHPHRDISSTQLRDTQG